MWQMIMVSFRGVVRDRVLQGILGASSVFFVIPVVSDLSMRQVAELSITLSLSLISFVLLLVAVFLGGTSLWRDIERRYCYGVLGLPLGRGSYLLGKFFGIALFIGLVSLILGLVAAGTITLSSLQYPPSRPFAWGTIALAVAFDALKYIFLVSFAFLLGSVSTSFFLPIFGTIAVFLVSSVSQQVYEFLQTPMAQKLPTLVRETAGVLYYLLPNFSAFDLKTQAIYNLPLDGGALFLTLGYFVTYTGLVLCLAVTFFSRRTLQ